MEAVAELLDFYRNVLTTRPEALFWFHGMMASFLATTIGWIAYKELSEGTASDNGIHLLMIVGLLVPSLTPLGWPPLDDALLGMGVMGLMFLWVRLGMVYFKGASSLGFSEVRFAAAAGLWCGFEGTPLFMIAAMAFGVAAFWTARFLRRLRGLPASAFFPFSPALGAGLFSAICLRMYLGL